MTNLRLQYLAREETSLDKAVLEVSTGLKHRYKADLDKGYKVNSLTVNNLIRES